MLQRCRDDGGTTSTGWTGEWTFRSSWGRAREVYRDEGVSSLWFKLLGELCYRRVWVFERPLTVGATSRVELPDDVSLDELTPDEIDGYLELRPGTDAPMLLQRLDAGERCVVARQGGRLLHAAWVSPGRAWIEYLDRTIELADDEAYVYEVFSAPEARRRALSVAVADAIADRMRAAGCRRLLAVVMPENHAGARAVMAWRYRRCGTLRSVRLGRWRRDLGGVGRGARDLGATYWGEVPGRLDDGRHYLDPFVGELKRRRHLRLVREWGGLEADGRLLKTDAFEEAMGSDSFLAELCGEVGEVWGMDIAPAVVRRAHVRSGSPDVRWTVADARRLPFPDGHFSTIVSTSTLDHFPDPRDLGRSLRELLRVLRPGGSLVLTLDNRQNVFDPLLRLAVRLGALPYYVGRSYTVHELRDELLAAGFDVLETTAILHNPRLTAVLSMKLARWCRFGPVIRGVERLLVAAQRLEGTRWRYRTGSFVAAVATRPATASGATAGI